MRCIGELQLVTRKTLFKFNIMADNLRISMVQSHIFSEEPEDENLGLFMELFHNLTQRQTDNAPFAGNVYNGFFYGCGKAGRHDGWAYYSYYKGVGEEILSLLWQVVSLQKKAGNISTVLFSSRPKVKLICMTSGICSGWRAKTSISQPGINGRSYGIRTGISVCRFLMIFRFPVWSRNVDNEYDLLIYVANWPEARKKVWKTLLQARAMENMAYVCGVNRVGIDGKGFVYRGDSMIFYSEREKAGGCRQA